jgi:DNA-binding NtrC family response regulator
MNLVHPSVLLIDDQWGRSDDPMIPERYGSLPFKWLLESAADEAGEHSTAVALARVRREAQVLAAVLLDIDFGKSRNRLGIDILQTIRTEFPTLPVLMFTRLDSDENRELVIRCMELGANEYVEKTPSAARMQEILSVYTDPNSDRALYGNSAPIRLLRAKIARVAFSGETSVLIVGESGTGKELVARALHRQGPRKHGPFVPKNCAHSDLQLLDSELFGHERGAFTGAVAQRRGLIEEADGGVLFLDEIADMPLELQAKLLRTLETRTFRRVGGSRDLESRFQLVCAVNQSPEELTKSGRLRVDFYYRIATMTLHVPPLRERRDDVPILAEWFLKRFKAGGGASYPGKRFASAFLSRLQQHTWPGNVRELRNVIEQAVILSRETVIGVEELPESFISEANSAVSSADALSDEVVGLPDSPADWPKARLVAELRLALKVRQRVQAYKGNQWKAEFMRLMYPECRAANAKGFDDLIKRLTQGPWGYSRWQDDSELAELIAALRR